MSRLFRQALKQSSTTQATEDNRIITRNRELAKGTPFESYETNGKVFHSKETAAIQLPPPTSHTRASDLDQAIRIAERDRKNVPGKFRRIQFSDTAEQIRKDSEAILPDTDIHVPDLPQEVKDQKMNDIAEGRGLRIRRPNVPMTPEIREALLEHLSAGGTLASFGRKIKAYSPYQISNWVKKDPELAAEVANIRRTVGADAIAEEALRIATTPFMQEEVIETYDQRGNLLTRAVKTTDAVYARKLAFQARMTLLSKWAPDRYGEGVKAEVSSSLAQKLAAARDRLKGAEIKKIRDERRTPLGEDLPGIKREIL